MLAEGLLKFKESSNHCQSLVKARSTHSEVIPDSEEERQHEDKCTKSPLHKTVEVIEISSEESERYGSILSLSSPRLKREREYSEEPKSWPGLHKLTTANLPNDAYQTPKRGRSRPNFSLRRVIESSDDDSHPEVIELSDSSVESTPAKLNSMGLKVAIDAPPSHTHLTIDESADESIIIFDERRGARRPMRSKGIGPSTTIKTDGIRHNIHGSSNPRIFASTANSSSTKPSASDSGRGSQARPRVNNKKAVLEAELRRRKEYAQQLFTDLNELVFNQCLPFDTQLNWNKRLLTTAGRAKFHRSREGIQTTEIELAEKILDCDERIQNTLSHEMCHLATWVIDNKVDEHHGKLFKHWASLVMKKRPDIHVSIKHDYEISYPFEWKCEKCAKVYGRFSKSIRPDECVCGACKEGTLVPLFTTRTPSKKPTKLSRMAATKPQDSPVSAQGTASKNHVTDPSASNNSEIEFLTNIFAMAGIGDREEVD